MNEAELLIEYAKSWNKLDISYIENLLDEDLEYASQWVFETMYGKDAYLEYLEGKYNAIRNSSNLPVAELGYYKVAYGEENKACLVITQGNEKTAILVQTKNGKLSKINMVGIPLPKNAILFDMKPK